MEHIRCVVERITYQNAQNGYSVIKCKAKNFQDLVTVVGEMPDVHVGSVLSLGGFWKMDAKYGRQFTVQELEETLPATVYGIEKYLGSGLVKGIGPKYAQKIVRQFGKDTLEVIEETPDELLKVPGIGKIRVERIKKSWTEQKEIKNIMLFLQSHDVSTSHATKIYKTYGNESIQIVQENPYRLADDIWGIGFKTADTIAEKMGFDHEKYVRLRSGILYTLNRLSEEGHCYATREQLIETGKELLSVEDGVLSITLDEMIRAQDVITEEIALPPEAPADQIPEKAIYLPPFFFSESGTARRLKAILENKEGIQVGTIGLAERISRRTRMQYDRVQMQAIETAVRSKILILTGGPGTGKTTTTLGIITAFREAGAKILLAAPTGRAAKRLSEAVKGAPAKPASWGEEERRNVRRSPHAGADRSGVRDDEEAKTIHRLLEVKPPEGYQKNEENPLEGDVLIVDECSMIDIMLMYNLLKAVPDTMTLILVGDIDQLPSVGAGNVLRDMIDSGCFPVVRLTRIFRQAQSSRIVMNAHRINAGKMPDISNGKTTDFFFIDMEKEAEKVQGEAPGSFSPENQFSEQLSDQAQSAPSDPPIAEMAAAEIVSLVKMKLSRYYRTPPREIQVLTPMQRGIVGAANLNQALQEAINPAPGNSNTWYPQPDQVLRRGGMLYRRGDKVMQIRNNYDKEVFNGDIGFIESIDMEERTLRVNIDDRSVEYDATELDELVLAYATTIHKAQGSEYPIVVIPVLMNHYVMLQRNLIYTGITRAKKILVLVGTKKALAYAVHHLTVDKRNTMLKERLQKALPVLEKLPETPGALENQSKQSKQSVRYQMPAQSDLMLVAETPSEYGSGNQQKKGQKDRRRDPMSARPDSDEKPDPQPQPSIIHDKWLKIDLFTRIGQSNFRSRFHLTEKDKAYVAEKGMPVIRSHAEDLIAKRLAPADIPNDGKQTPMRGHPVFIGQHATGTCCRGCLEKWHGIRKGHELTKAEQAYVVDVLMQWIERQMKGYL